MKHEQFPHNLSESGEASAENPRLSATEPPKAQGSPISIGVRIAQVVVFLVVAVIILSLRADGGATLGDLIFSGFLGWGAATAVPALFK